MEKGVVVVVRLRGGLLQRRVWTPTGVTSTAPCAAADGPTDGWRCCGCLASRAAGAGRGHWLGPSSSNRVRFWPLFDPTRITSHLGTVGDARPAARPSLGLDPLPGDCSARGTPGPTTPRSDRALSVLLIHGPGVGPTGPVARRHDHQLRRRSRSPLVGCCTRLIPAGRRGTRRRHGARTPRCCFSPSRRSVSSSPRFTPNRSSSRCSSQASTSREEVGSRWAGMTAAAAALADRVAQHVSDRMLVIGLTG